MQYLFNFGFIFLYIPKGNFVNLKLSFALGKGEENGHDVHPLCLEYGWNLVYLTLFSLPVTVTLEGRHYCTHFIEGADSLRD